MHRMLVVILGGTSTGGALGTVISRSLEVGTPAMVALYMGTIVVGFGLFSTLMYGRPWPGKVEE